jgi:hypothetical protein
VLVMSWALMAMFRAASNPRQKVHFCASINGHRQIRHTQIPKPTAISNAAIVP